MCLPLTLADELARRGQRGMSRVLTMGATLGTEPASCCLTTSSRRSPRSPKSQALPEDLSRASARSACSCSRPGRDDRALRNCVCDRGTMGGNQKILPTPRTFLTTTAVGSFMRIPEDMRPISRTLEFATLDDALTWARRRSDAILVKPEWKPTHLSSGNRCPADRVATSPPARKRPVTTLRRWRTLSPRSCSTRSGRCVVHRRRPTQRAH